VTTPEVENESITTGPPRRGLAIASVAIGSAGLVVALSTWVAWLTIRPGLQDAVHYSWISQVFVLVLGALWFAMLPAAVLGLVFGFSSGARAVDGPSTARAGAYLALLTLAITLAGAAAFVLTPSAWSPPANPIGVYGTYFN
jgi:hypothetical protein